MDSGRADLTVRYTLGAARRIQRKAYPAGRREMHRQVRVPYTEGAPVLDPRAPSTRSLVWRAIARQRKSDPAALERKPDDMVRKSVAQYPPKSHLIPGF